MSVVDETTDTGRELREVEDWNDRRMLEIGVPPGDAITLAKARVDWHDAKALLDHGCPPELVRGILA